MKKKSGKLPLVEADWKQRIVGYDPRGTLIKVFSSEGAIGRVCGVERSANTFVALFGAIALSIAVAHAFLAPPFQSPDEENHFLRAVQLTLGSVVGERNLDRSNAGAILPKSAVALVDSFRYLAGKPNERLNGPALARARAVEWDWSEKQFVGFGNTVIYPPFLYAPAVTGVWLASAFSPNVLDALYLARLLNALSAGLIATLAVSICPPIGRVYLASILVLPMTLALFGSCNPDGCGIALAALVVAWWSSNNRGGISARRRLSGTAIVAVVSSTKLPYLPFLAVALLRWPEGRLNARALGAIAVLASIPIVLAIWLAAAAKVEFRPNAGVASLTQLQFVLEHPLQFSATLLRTATTYWHTYVEQMIGVLGWLDTSLPSPAYRIYDASILLAGTQLVVAGVRTSDVLRDRLIAVVMVLCVLLGLFFTLYLNWTPVGAPLVEGVQGRYFLVPLLFVPLIVGPNLDAGHRPGALAVINAIGLFVLLVGGLGLWFVPIALLSRYYG